MLKIDYFVRERKDPLLIMTWVMSQWWWTNWTWTSEFQDYYIPLWSTRRIPAFDNWFRKLRIIQIDMLFNKIYDRNNQVIFSVQNQNKWFTMLGNIEFCDLLETEPNTQCTVCYHSGISENSTARTCGHFFRQGKMKNQKLINYTMVFLSVLEYVIKKEHLTDIDMVKSRETRNTTRLINWRRDHRDEELYQRWDALADEDHTHHLTAQKYLLYKNKWWLHSNKQGSNITDRHQCRHVWDPLLFSWFTTDETTQVTKARNNQDNSLPWICGPPMQLQLWETGPWCGCAKLQGRQDAAPPTYTISTFGGNDSGRAQESANPH